MVLLCFTFIEFLHVKQQNDDYCAGDTTVGEIKYRTKEEHLAGAVVNEREIEHVHHFAVEPTRALEKLPVEDTVDNVA